MIGVIGVGQAGNMLADKFAEYGHPSLAINYSQMDLNSCSNVNETLKLVGSEGAGRDRKLATSLMMNNYESILSFVKKNFSQPSTQLILVMFSTGGGTGSGVSPLLIELLQNELSDKTIVSCPILPSINESVISHINTMECLQELANLETCILPIDNNKFAYKMSKNELFEYINTQFFLLVTSIIEQTEKSSKNGNLDQKDLLALFNTSGFASISHLNAQDMFRTGIYEDKLTNHIQNSWDDSIITNPSMDKIIRFGLIYDGSERLIKHININSLISNFKTYPLDVFEGYYHEGNGDIYTIMTGLNFNQIRLNEIEHRANEKSEQIQESLSQGHSISFKSNIEMRGKSKPKKSLSSILSKYNN